MPRTRGGKVQRIKEFPLGKEIATISPLGV